MTTERTTPPAGFDTLAEARRLEAAGVPAEHGAAMLYAAIAAADAHNAELREETERRHAELREEMERNNAELRRDNADLRKDNAELRKDVKRDNAGLRKDIEISRWKIVAALFLASSFVIAGVKFVLEWPIG